MSLCPTTKQRLIDSCALIKSSNSAPARGMHLSQEISRKKERTALSFKMTPPPPVPSLPRHTDAQQKSGARHGGGRRDRCSWCVPAGEKACSPQAAVESKRALCHSLWAVFGSAVVLCPVYPHSLVASWHSDTVGMSPSLFISQILWYNGLFTITTTGTHTLREQTLFNKSQRN